MNRLSPEKVTTPPELRRLSLKQERFVLNYLANNGIGYLAAKQAGYKGGNTQLAVQATDNLRKPNIIYALAHKQAKMAEKLQITAEKVLSDLEHQRLGAEAKGDFSSAIRATELQGKYLALFTDNHAFKAPTPEPLSDTETQQLRLMAMQITTTRPSKALGLPRAGLSAEQGLRDGQGLDFSQQGGGVGEKAAGLEYI